MNPTDLIPAAGTLPLRWEVFEILLTITFIPHLLFMNALAGGTAVALADRLRGGDHALGRALAAKLPTLLALTVNLGIPPLLFLQVLYGRFFYVAAILSAVYWMALAGLAMAAYAFLYRHKFLAEGGRPDSAGWLAAAACLLPLIALTLTNATTLMLDPKRWLAWLDDPSGLMFNWTDPSLAPRFLHFMLAALAVGGLFAALLGRKDGRPDWERRGLSLFKRATVLQMLSGVWWLTALPKDVVLKFMGETPQGTLVLMIGLALSGLALAGAFRKNLHSAVFWTIATVAVMVLMRALVRTFSLPPGFEASSLPSADQWSPLLFFLGISAAGAGALVWLLHVWNRGAAPAAKE